MLAPLPGQLSGYQLPHYFSDPIAFFDIPDDSLNDFMALMAATDPTMQTPSPSSEGSSWISESPSPTPTRLRHDAGLYFHSPMLNDAGHLLMASPINPLHQADSDFADNLRQSISHPDCAPVNSNPFSPPSDIPWSTNTQTLPSLGEASPTRDIQRIPLPRFSSEQHSTSQATHHIRPTCLLPNYNGVDTHPVYRGWDPSYQRDPRAMRECLMRQAEGKPSNEAFRKSAKDIVASPNTRKASSARRKYAAKFKCPIDGCNDDFTRKHNLDNHLRSHCGITDLICNVCNLGFTTIPVWKRHKKTCRHPPFPT